MPAKTITRNNNVIPVLKRSGDTNNAAAWNSVVVDGGLMHSGMISGSRFLPPDGAETIRNYVQSEARKALAAPAQPAGPPARSLTPTEAAT